MSKIKLAKKLGYETVAEAVADLREKRADLIARRDYAEHTARTLDNHGHAEKAAGYRQTAVDLCEKLWDVTGNYDRLAY